MNVASEDHEDEYVVTIVVDGESYSRPHATLEEAELERRSFLERGYSTEVTIAIRKKQ